MVKPHDLPIYAEPTSKAEYRVVVHEKGHLEDAVSVLRKQIWSWTNSCQGVIEKTRKVYHTAEKSTKDVVEFIKTEENLAPRVAVVGLAGLTGVVLARRGGILRKTLYSTILMAGTASVCYPYQAVRIAKNEWQWVDNKLGLQELYQRTTEKIGLNPAKSDKPENTTTSSQPAAADVENKSTPVDKSMMDHGQSNPADKDMYTTRS